MNQPVLVAAGGTGGHVIPALAVADVLKKRDVPVIWLGTRSGLEARLVPAAGIDIRWINVTGLRGKNILQTLMGPLRLIRACVQSMRLVHSLKPRAVLGMGGFVSGPVAIAALLMRKPLVLHEQNAVAGMTNRWLSTHASRVFCAWPGVFAEAVDARVVGNPVTRDMASLAMTPNAVSLDQNKPLRLMVVGGSRGARALNELVPAAVGLLQAPVTVVHQAGSDEVEQVRQRYASAGTAEAIVTAFIDDMATAYQHCDVVICRSGAMTVTELSALGVPSILVPYPFAVDDHQTVNARHLSDSGAAVLISQSCLTAESLAEVIEQLNADRGELAAMSLAAQACFTPHAAEAVADALMEVSN